MMPYTQNRRKFNLSVSILPRIMPDLANYITAQEAAERLGFHVVHVRRMIREGDLEGKKVGYMWFITKESIEKYLKETEGLSKFDPRRGNK